MKIHLISKNWLMLAISLFITQLSLAQFGGGYAGAYAVSDLQSSKTYLYTSPGTYTQTQYHRNGTTVSYADLKMDGTRYLLATVQDSLGGNEFDSLRVSTTVYAAGFTNNTSRHFVPRKYSITPVSNGIGTVTLYYTQADFDAYNILAIYNNKLPLNGADALNNKANIRLFRSQSNFETPSLVTINNPIVTWNNTDSFWTITFTPSDAIQGDYYISSPFLSTKMASNLSHNCPVPVYCQNNASVTVRWNTVPGAQDYRFRMRIQGSNNWSVGTVTDTFKTQLYLLYNTAYEAQVRVRESATNQGEYTTSYFFTTPAPPLFPSCTSPANINHQVVSGNATTISWNSVANGANYSIEIKQSSAASWGGTTLADTFYTFQSLAPNTSYDYRIRTSCSPGTSCVSSSNFSAIGTFTTFTVAALPTCNPVTSIQASAITEQTATLSWNSANYASSYTLQWRIKGTLPWNNNAAVSSTSYNLVNLSPNTTYEYQLRTQCEPESTATATSNFTAIGEFTTLSSNVLPTCLPPTNINVTNITANMATIQWASANNAQSYFVQVKPASSASWGGGSTTTTSRTVNFLSPNTLYDYRIRSTCNNNTTWNAMSNFSSIGQFTTLALPSLANFNTIETPWLVYPNPTQNNVTVSFATNNLEPISCQLFDITGRNIKTIAYEPMKGNNDIEISLSELASGVYTLKIEQANSPVFIRRIQKL